MCLSTDYQILIEHSRKKLSTDYRPLRVSSQEDDICFLQRLYPFFPFAQLRVELVDSIFYLTLTFESDRLDVEGRYSA